MGDDERRSTTGNNSRDVGYDPRQKQDKSKQEKDKRKREQDKRKKEQDKSKPALLLNGVDVAKRF